MSDYSAETSEPQVSSRSVRLYIEELIDFSQEQDDNRNHLVAYGVSQTAITALVAACDGDETHYEQLLQATANNARQSIGDQAVGVDELRSRTGRIHELELELIALRKTAMREGLNARVLNQLAQLMRLSPGDQGAGTLSTMLDYAIRFGLDIKGLKPRIDQAAEDDTVIPDIPRPVVRRSRGHLLRDVALGVVFGLMFVQLLGV